MLPWLDVASGREPELRTFVVYEKDVASVNNGCRFSFILALFTL
jgi:hypothetical protein